MFRQYLKVHRYFSVSTKASRVTEKTEGHWVEKLLHNCFLEKYTLRPRNFKQRLALGAKDKKNNLKDLQVKHHTVSSVALKYLDVAMPELEKEQEQVDFEEELEGSKYEGEVQYPYGIFTDFSQMAEGTENNHDSSLESNNPGSLENIAGLSESDDKPEDSEESNPQGWVHNYGVPNPNIPASKVPCGGCGAFLQCQDSGIPGYIPSESFTKLKEMDLKTEICQRCFFLKEHKAYLNVNISPNIYPKILSRMKHKRGLVILLVDLVDFPCSIWPGMADIIGEKRPVILVGNKVDLIPRDSRQYLKHVEQCLRYAAEDLGLNRCRIIHTALISATTGYGVEDLISSIYTKWDYKDDIYIMGCTNVGKSSLFNVFLQSDLCKVQAVDLVQRATVSQWPGTTLNLLKFPVVNNDGYKLHLRHERLKTWSEDIVAERKLREIQLRRTKNPAYATLIGRVGRSYRETEDDEKLSWLNNTQDLFHVNTKSFNLPKLSRRGAWDPSSHNYAHGRWCFDTPGTVNENQILNKLLLPELMKVLPKKTIEPRSYFIRLGRTLFVGGIARIDYVSGNKPIRMTVFASSLVPVTVLETADANEIYEKGLGTPVFGVPMGNKERLAQFPPLKPRDFTVEGISDRISCSDIVISGAGWVAVSANKGDTCQLTVHTPNGSGMFCRQPSLLPNIIRLKGHRIRNTVAYGKHHVYLPDRI